MSETIKPTVERLLASYGKEAHLKGDLEAFLPKRDRIVELLQICRALIFPGYFTPQSEEADAASYQVGGLLLALHEGLSEEIFHALCHYKRIRSANPACRDCERERGEAAELAMAFVSRLPDVRALISTDVQAALEGDPAAQSYSEVILSYPGVFAVVIYRLAHELYKLDVPMIPRVMSEYAHSKTGIDIHPGAEIGAYFFIDHGTGVVIGETTVIGARVKLYQGVTLGALSTRGGQRLRGVRRHPTLGDDVTVYGGATILGGDTVIGDGVTIGGNVFIAQSVDPAQRVVLKSPELEFRNKG